MIGIIMQSVLKVIMFLVKGIRNDNSHYLSAPEHILGLVKIDRIMKLWHTLPSVIVTVLLAVKVFPLISSPYAQLLKENSPTISLVVIAFLIPVSIINGVVIESVLEKINPDYRQYKTQR